MKCFCGKDLSDSDFALSYCAKPHSYNGKTDELQYHNNMYIYVCYDCYDKGYTKLGLTIVKQGKDDKQDTKFRPT